MVTIATITLYLERDYSSYSTPGSTPLFILLFIFTVFNGTIWYSSVTKAPQTALLA